MFKHFLITHFNLLNFPLGIDGNEEWLNWTRKRIQVFKTYCLPSLTNQTIKDFTWLIYFDINTPAEFNYLIDELKEYNFIKPCFANGFDGFMENYMNEIKVMAGDTKWIITSRIDNDDCFHKDAMRIIQEYFIPSDEHLISLASGYTFDVHHKTLSHYYYPMSPFISIIESMNKKNLKGIWYIAHSRWEELNFSVRKEIFRKNKKSTFVLHNPYWLQILHGENIANSVRGLPVLRQKDLTNFGVPIISKGQSLLNVFAYYDYVIWKRYFKTLIVRLFINHLSNKKP